MQRSTIVSLIIVVLLTCSHAALAESSTQAAAKAPPILPSGLVGVIGGANDSPFIIGAITPVDHMVLGAGLSFNYNGYGQRDAAGNVLNDKVASSLVLATEYMVVDRAPFAMGPELFLVGSLAPGKALDYLLVRPAWAFWWTPWNGSIAVGSALALEIQVPTQRDQKAIVNLLTPGIRLGYIFNGI